MKDLSISDIHGIIETCSNNCVSEIKFDLIEGTFDIKFEKSQLLQESSHNSDIADTPAVIPHNDNTEMPGDDPEMIAHLDDDLSKLALQTNDALAFEDKYV